MRNVVIAIMILILSSVGLYVSLVSPIKTWGEARKDYVWDACACGNNIYVLGGVSDNMGYPHIAVFKLNLKGRIVNSWILTNASIGISILPYSMSIYVAGKIYDATSEYGVLIKLSTNLNVVWLKILEDFSEIKSMYIYANRIYLIGSRMAATASYIIALDVHGNILWTQPFSNARSLCVYMGDLYVISVERGYLGDIMTITHIYSDGEYISADCALEGNIKEIDFIIRENKMFIAGRITDPDLKTDDVFILCYDMFGDVFIWDLTWGTSGTEYGCAVTFSDGYIYVTGKIMNNKLIENGDVLLLKISTKGKILWSRTYDFGLSEDIGKSIVAYSDSLFIIGETLDGGEHYYDAFIMRVNSYGEATWQVFRVPKRGFGAIEFCLSLIVGIASLIYLINTRRLTYILRKEYDYII